MQAAGLGNAHCITGQDKRRRIQDIACTHLLSLLKRSNTRRAMPGGSNFSASISSISWNMSLKVQPSNGTRTCLHRGYYRATQDHDKRQVSVPLHLILRNALDSSPPAATANLSHTSSKGDAYPGLNSSTHMSSSGMLTMWLYKAISSRCTSVTA